MASQLHLLHLQKRFPGIHFLKLENLGRVTLLGGKTVSQDKILTAIKVFAPEAVYPTSPNFFITAKTLDTGTDEDGDKTAC